MEEERMKDWKEISASRTDRLDVECVKHVPPDIYPLDIKAVADCHPQCKMSGGSGSPTHACCTSLDGTHVRFILVIVIDEMSDTRHAAARSYHAQILLLLALLLYRGYFTDTYLLTYLLNSLQSQYAANINMLLLGLGYIVLTSGGSSGSTSGTGIASPLIPISTPGDPLTEDDISAVAGSVSSSAESVLCDSVVVSELVKWDSIS